MKKKLLAILLTISCLLAFNNNVFAAKATASNSKDGLGGGTLKGPEGFNSGYYAKATFNGVEAYCIDPGKKPVANGTQCDVVGISNDSEFAKAAEYIFSSSKSETQKGVAIRIVAIVAGQGSIKYDSSSSDSINARCGYISAAYQAAKKAGTTVKSSGLTGYKSSGGTKCTDWKVTGDVIQFAADALSAAKKAPKAAAATGEKPTATVTTSGGKAKVTVKASDKTGEVKVNIICDSNTTGDCGEKTITKTTTFNLTSKVNNAEQCGTFKATMTYGSKNADVNPNECTEVTEYSCGALQNYVGCTAKGGSKTTGDGKTPRGDGSGQTTETIKDPNVGGETIHIKCDDKKRECPVTEDDVTVVADGNGLCDADGKEVIKVNEATTFTQDVEACIIGNEKFLVSSSDSGVCKTYCVEDYSFESDGLMLSSQDKDAEGNITITAGSYFNFANPNPKAHEKGVVKCYTKLDLNTFKKNVETAANQACAQNMTSVKHSCNCTTDPETGATSCVDNVITTTYEARFNGNKVEFIPTQTPSILTPSTCDGITDTTADTSSCKENYKSMVNRYITELQDCEKQATEAVNYDKECNSKVVFDYGFNVDPIELKAENKEANDTTTYHASCNGDYSKCSDHSNSKQKANLDLGIGESVEYPTLEYVEKVSTITAEYTLKGVGICNNYNDGTSNYPVSEDDCKSKEGTTWVEGWPVSYDTPQNEYKYEITVSDFGHIKAADKCKTLDHYLKDKVVIGCKYKVNGCKECEYICEPSNPNCDYQECDKECIYECAGVGCIYDSGNGLALNYQPISTINVDSSFAYLTDRYDGVRAVATGRETAPRATKLATTATHRDVASVNWGTEKGQATLDVIEDQGEEIYSGKPEYKVTLTMSKINDIKKDNAREAEGFLNKSLECKVSDPNLEYVTCESKFLKELKAEGILEYKDGSAKFESVKEISNYVTGYNVTSARKSGTGPAWK